MNRIRRAVPWALVVLSGLFAILGLGDVFAGITFEPTTALAITGKTIDEIRAESAAAYTVIDYNYRGGGLTLTMFATLMTIVLAIPYRRAERWAYWAAWLLPVWAAALFVLAVVHGTAPSQAISAVAWSGIGLAIVTAAMLLVDFRRFRPTAATPVRAAALT